MRYGWVIVAALLTARAPAAEGPVAERAAALVEQLADSSAKVRDRASRDLAALDGAAVPALEAGLKHADAEVRARCRRLLDAERDGRLRAFVADTADKADYGLAAWSPKSRYRRLYGRDRDCRQLFADLYRLERPLLEELDRDPKRAADLVQRRFDALRERHRNGLKYTEGELLPLLLVAADDRVTLPVETPSWLCGMVTYTVEGKGPKTAAGRKLWATVMERMADQGKAVSIAEAAWQEGLVEFLPAAVRLARNPDAPAQARGRAALFVGKFGTPANLADLEPLLDSKVVVAYPAAEAPLADLALAAMVRLSGQRLKDYGFRGFRSGVLSEDRHWADGVRDLSFRDEPARRAARDKWRDWAETQKKKKAGP